MLTLVLASKSPRRRDLLEKAGFKFHSVSMEISEIINENLRLDDALMELARQKSDAILATDKLSELENFLLLSADTVVVLDSEVIGKPRDIADAQGKLGRLSGRSHLVKTAICVSEVKKMKLQKQVCALETSEVLFRELSSSEIRDYVREKMPLDKAGAYGVQDLPKGFITKIIGNIDNVMGLPVNLVKQVFSQNGWQVAQKL